MTHWPTSGTLSTILRGEGTAVLMMAQQGSWDWPAPQEISLGCEPGTEVGDRLPPRFPQPPAKPGEASLERSAPLWNKHTDEQDQCQGRSPKGPSTLGKLWVLSGALPPAPPALPALCLPQGPFVGRLAPPSWKWENRLKIVRLLPPAFRPKHHTGATCTAWERSLPQRPGLCGMRTLREPWACLSPGKDGTRS